MAGYAPRWTLMTLFKRGWNEIPEIMAASVLATMGYGLGIYAAYRHIKYDGDNKPYKHTYIVLRPDDPKTKLVHKIVE